MSTFYPRITASFLSLLLPLLLAGQSSSPVPYYDSLRTVLDQTEDVKKRQELIKNLLNVGPYMPSDYFDDIIDLSHMDIAIARESGDMDSLAMAWTALGGVYGRFGQRDSSRYYVDTAYQLVWADTTSAGRAEALVIAASNRGVLYQEDGQLQIALEAYQKAKRMVKALGRRREVILANNLGVVYMSLSRYEEALESYQEVLDFARETGNKRFEAISLRNIADIQFALGNVEEAKDYLNRSIALREELGDKEGIMRCLFGLSSIHLTEGDTLASVEINDDLLERAVASNNTYIEVEVLSTLLTFRDFLAASRYQKYVDHAERLAAEYGDDPSSTVRKSLYFNLANYYHIIGQNQKARKLADDYAEAVSPTSDTSRSAVDYLTFSAAINNALGRDEEAYYDMQKAHEFYDVIMEKESDEAVAEAATKLNLQESQLARARAEAATELERQASASRARFFWLALLAAGGIIAAVAFAYSRSRRAQKAVAAQKAIVDQSLAEKEVLLREIHHRVKNNLQIISSLLQKQARFSSDGDAQKLAQEGQERIQSMALVHENLYQSEQLSGVNIRSYLEDLGANISKSHARPGAAIQLELAVADEYLDLDTAIPVGLILNELLTNAYKYAFPTGEAGQIKVSFQKPGDWFQLQVSDDGVGLPADHAARSSKSLGHNLVKGLVRQLEGSIKWLAPERGTTITIEF